MILLVFNKFVPNVMNHTKNEHFMRKFYIIRI